MDAQTPLGKGSGPLFMPPDAEAGRERSRQKDKRLINKLTTVKEAIANYVNDGDYIASGGFGLGIRCPASRVSPVLVERSLPPTSIPIGWEP